MAKIMGIFNATPDSFWPGSRYNTSVFDGWADIIDIGGCSTRPGCELADEEEEWRRLEPVLSGLDPSLEISIDTFRPSIVRRAYDLLGRPFIVNDVSGGSEEMFSLVRSLGLPYVLMHVGPASETLSWFEKTAPLMEGIDWILDPGFGFEKDTVEENLRLVRDLPLFKKFGRPILVGISHKRMTRSDADGSPLEPQARTRELNALAASLGADILRVHTPEDY